MKRSPAIAALCAAVLTAGAGAAVATSSTTAKSPRPVVCTGDPDRAHRLDLTVAGVRTYGFYAVPKHRAKGIVVFAHGYGHTAYSWIEHAKRTARRDGVIAIAMNYHGQRDIPPAKGETLPSSRGWRVSEGARDSIAAAKLFDRWCKTGGLNTIYGVSMGGNASGLVAAAQPKDSRGKPLFDYWFAIEPAVNVTETWTEATLVAQSGNTYANNAVEDIEQEMGGTPAEVPDVYADRSVVARADDIAAAGFKGVVIVHGIDDGLVPYNQSRELLVALRALGMVVDDTTVGTRGDAETGTTLSGNVLGPAGQTSPFAGHGSEVSTTQLVIKTGFESLDALYRAGQAPMCRNSFRDGDTGEWLRSPASC
jgi:hypothetical protein